jgi:hypothetical protein
LARLARAAPVLLLAACASTPELRHENPLDDVRTPTAIAVVALPDAPSVEMQVFARGYAEGIPKSVGTGVLAGGRSTFFLLSQMHPFVAAAFATPLLASGAAVAIGVTAARIADVVPEDQAAAVEQLINDRVAAVAPSRLAAERMADDLARLTPYKATVASTTAPSYESLSGAGFKAVLEAKVRRIGFDASEGSMQLYLVMDAHLVGTSSGHPLGRRTLVYLSPRHRMALWTHDGGALARVEIERGLRTLAERAIESLVLKAEPMLATGYALAPATCGLISRQPPPVWEGLPFTQRRPGIALVDSLSPLLAWEERPPPDETGGDAASWVRARADDIRYDLRIWDSLDEAPANLVYEREGLAGTDHRVEQPLQPGVTYFWSVRMRYTVDGLPRATRWSAARAQMASAPLKILREIAYEREGGLYLPGCAPSELSPCGCLDFIPAENRYRFRTP